jgi:hypothetical protein
LTEVYILSVDPVTGAATGEPTKHDISPEDIVALQKYAAKFHKDLPETSKYVYWLARELYQAVCNKMLIIEKDENYEKED